MAANCSGGSPISAYSTLTSASTLGCGNSGKTGEIVTPSTLQVFPNPANSFVNVQYGSSVEGTALVRLVDITGKEVLQQKVSVNSGSNTFSVDIQQVPLGYYVLEVYDGANSMREKIVVSR